MKTNQSFNNQSMIWRIGDMIDILYRTTKSTTKSIYPVGCIIGLNIRLGDDFDENSVDLLQYDREINLSIYRHAEFFVDRNTMR